MLLFPTFGHIFCNDLAKEESILESLYMWARNDVHLARPMVCEPVNHDELASYFTIKWGVQFH